MRRDYGGGMVCEMIPEPEVTVGIVQGWPMGVLGLRAKREFYDYEAKYTKGLTEFTIPAPLEPATYQRALETAVLAAKALDCAELCRVDMRIAADGAPYVLDVNASPGMTETSDLPQGADYLGMSYRELALEVLGSALVRAGRISIDEWR
jgi:D-alanine-D-alanine ligase